MLPRIPSVLAAFLIIISTIQAPKALSQDNGLPPIPGPALCYLELKGQVKIDGVCQLFSEEGVIFLDDLNHSGYVAMLDGSSSDYSVYWNGKPGTPISSEFKKLGSVKRVGTCWIGSQVKLCIGGPDPEAPTGGNTICEDCG